MPNAWPRHLAAALLLLVALFVAHPALALALGAVLALATDVPLFDEAPERTSRWGKWLLQTAVVLLGLRLDLQSVVGISGQFLPLVASYVIGALLLGFALGALLRLDRHSTQLLSAGTAICGGTAVASLAPVIRASSATVAPVLGLIFLLNAMAILSLPVLGRWLGMSQAEFGLWVALAVHDTSSVLGTAAAYGAEALELATTVKLGRTLWLIPLLAVFGVLVGGRGRAQVPGFVLLFIGVAALNGFLTLPEWVAPLASQISGLALLAALFCIGLDLRRSTLRAVSPNLLALALGLWFLVLPLTWLAATRLV